MKFTLSWLKKFLITDASIEEVVDRLNKIGLEVEEVVNQSDIYGSFIVAEIISASPHPEADKLRVCKVNNGKEILQIVCGAPNARENIKVVLAPIGVEIPTNGLKIRKSKIRNIESFGMLCSSSELGLGEDSDGIIELDKNYEVGDSLDKAYGLNEVFIEISITPNRGDCLGVYGIARDLAASGLGKLKSIAPKSKSGDFESPIKVSLESDNCLRYIGRYFKDVKNSQSPKWLQDDLKSIGLKPISALVDITNYFTFAYGRPLHVFDADLVNEVKVCDAIGGEEITALNDKSYKMNKGELIIKDGDKQIEIAGIIGEKFTGVSLDSKNIFLEIGLFDADSVAKTGRAHQIDSDAKYRFERRVDSEIMSPALDLATDMIMDICGGEISHPVIVDNLKYIPRQINFPLSKLEKYIGISYDKALVKDILLNLGFIVEDLVEELKLTIPSWRSDISSNEDIVEEIARIDGYDNITSHPLPLRDVSDGFLDLKQKTTYRISRFAASLGLNEAVTWSFMSSKKAQLFTDLKDDLYLKNPISSELDYMRSSIIPNLLEVLEKNQNRGINDAAFFEMGSIFHGIKPDQQMLTITGIRGGYNNGRNIYADHRLVDVFDSKKDILLIIEEMGLDPSKLQYKIKDLPKYYHPGRSSALALGKNIIGYFGEIHPQIIKHYNLNNNAVGFELFLDNIPLPKPKYGRKANLEASDYQMVERDFAFIVDQDVSVDSIIRAVSQIDKKLIKDVQVFDIYTGKGMEENRKSVAFNVHIQALDHTLLESEIDELCQKIIDTVVKNTNGILRN